MYNKISPELSRIVAHICGDGYILSRRRRRSKNELIIHPRRNIFRKTYAVRYVNTEPALVKQFIFDVKKEFKRSVIKLRKFEYELSGKKVYDIITGLGAGKSHDWFISKRIFNSNKKVKIAWLKSFLDDEAHVSKEKKKSICLAISSSTTATYAKRFLT
jgi:hypothetical protein